MTHRDIITIGGSAGSIESLKRIVAQLPLSLHAAIFVVIHRGSLEKSWLAQVINRASQFPADEAADGERIEQGRIYLAPPDYHLLVAEDHIHLTRGPKEGLHRPSINITFRSAARAYGNRVIGVLLSGMLDDGASGLWEIVHHGGISIVQHPDEAQFPSMPIEALKDVPINYKLPSVEIGHRLVDLANQSIIPDGFQFEEFVNDVAPERFSGFTCPECRGPLYEHRKKPTEFKCRTGHVFPLRTLVEESAATQERKMYEAIVSLEEGSDMAEYAATEAEPEEKERFLAEGRQLKHHALAVRKLIQQRAALSSKAPSASPADDRSRVHTKSRA